MPAPPTLRGRRMRDHLVVTAAGLFLERGVHRVGLDEVLRAAGASKSQLYHYFSSKDALVQDVIAYQRSTVLGAHADTLERVGGWPELAAWLDAVVSVQEAGGWREGCRIGLLAAELAEADEAGRRAVAECFAAWEALISAALGRMRAAGLLRAGADPDRLATSTLATLQGGMLLARTARDGEPMRRAAGAALEHLSSWAADDASRG